MQNKPNDILYLGCRAEKIFSAQPSVRADVFRMLVYWIKERSRIHLKKDCYNLPKPWTEDPILQSVRFTNVRREFDKETQYLIKTVCNNSDLSYTNKLANIFLFRIVNKRESLIDIFPIDFEKTLPYEVFEAWENHFPEGYALFKKVYMISGPIGQIRNLMSSLGCPYKSSFMSVISCADYLFKSGKLNPLTNPLCNAKDLYDAWCNLQGIGSFLAYQMLIDMTYCPECLVSENEFVVAGPGCKEGLKLLFESRAGMTPEECLFWVRDNWNNLLAYSGLTDWNPQELFSDIPQKDRYMNVMSLQNCFCELFKYYRAYNGGHTIQKYNKGR